MEFSVLWRSPLIEDNWAFMEEHTSIMVHRLEENVRKIDFRIELFARVPGVTIGGSEDAKGYGGFCTRIRMPEDLIFTAQNGPVTPQTLQISAGPWMDFSASYGRSGDFHGITLLCHPDNPIYPAPWILRQKGSMQNSVFPGQERVAISMDKPTVLQYRLIIHPDNASSVDIPEWQAEYESIQEKKRD